MDDPVQCAACSGRGMDPFRNVPCPICGGIGEVERQQRDAWWDDYNAWREADARRRLASERRL